MIGFSNKAHRVLLVSEEEKGINDLVRKIRASRNNISSLAYYNLNGCYGVQDSGKFVEKPVYCNSPAEGIAKVIKETKSNEVFISSPISYHTIVDTMIKLNGDSVKFLLSPGVYEKCTGMIGRVNGWVMPAVDMNTGNLSPPYRYAKKFMDILVSLFALIAFLPLFLIIPILIKLTSRGPVFYTQMRCGHNGRPFKIYKFRSMIPDADKLLSEILDLKGLKEPVFKLKDDPRVTWIGKILRKTSLDELPQLFNVIKGDLSLVGPRPEETALVERYNPYFRERLKVKPGITGLQQVTCRGSTSLHERMKYDLAYIKRQSLWLDMKLLFKTFGVVLLQKRAT